MKKNDFWGRYGSFCDQLNILPPLGLKMTPVIYGTYRFCIHSCTGTYTMLLSLLLLSLSSSKSRSKKMVGRRRKKRNSTGNDDGQSGQKGKKKSRVEKIEKRRLPVRQTLLLLSGRRNTRINPMFDTS